MISTAFSIYLDLIRFLAALGVFTTHLSFQRISGGIGWQFKVYGGIAIAVFFVLSGYVIAYVTSTRENTLSSYITSRISRLYSVILIALPLTYCFDLAGLAANPELYAKLKSSEISVSYLSSLFLVNEYQVFHFGGIAPGTNVPFWSLSFEFTYYLLAAFILFFRPLTAIVASTIVLFFAGKTIIILLPTWALGYFAYKYRNLSSNFSKTGLIFVAIISGLFLAVGIPLLADILPKDNFGIFFPWSLLQQNRFLAEDYLVALTFCLHLFAMQHLLQTTTFRNNIERLIRWLGMLTFPLYLIHMPAMYFMTAISPFAPKSLSNLAFIVINTIVIVMVIAPVCEKFKHILRKLLT
jgi:peptidoglycan/LPS O-acetylase OafA/YrhL